MKPFHNKKAAAFCTILLAGALCTGCPTGSAANGIQFHNDEVLYNGKSIGTDTANAVYMSTFTEFHEDVAEQYQDTVNTIINITKGGIYQISGEASDTNSYQCPGRRSNAGIERRNSDKSYSTGYPHRKCR